MTAQGSPARIDPDQAKRPARFSGDLQPRLLAPAKGSDPASFCASLRKAPAANTRGPFRSRQGSGFSCLYTWLTDTVLVWWHAKQFELGSEAVDPCTNVSMVAFAK